MKIFRLILFILVLVNTVLAETDTLTFWQKFKTGGNGSLIFNQISFLNWAKGGENAISSTALFNYYANFKNEKFSWENIIDLKYGLQISDEFGLRTNQDVIDLTSKLGYKAKENFYYGSMINFKSQFAPGYNYPNDSVVVSKFLSPGYLIISLGLDYKPIEDLSLYLSPMTGKFIFVLDRVIADKGTYTSEPALYDNNGIKVKDGMTIKSDFGFYFKLNYKAEVFENIELNTKFEIFNNYTDKVIENRKNFDIDWESSLMMKVNEFISANLLLHLIYDNDIKVPLYEYKDGKKIQVGGGPRLQFKEVIGVGISYKFQ